CDSHPWLVAVRIQQVRVVWTLIRGPTDPAAPEMSLWRFDPLWRSVIPDGRYTPKDVAGDRHPADGRERQVSGHQRLAGRRELPQKTDSDASRLLGVVLEAV